MYKLFIEYKSIPKRLTGNDIIYENIVTIFARENLKQKKKIRLDAENGT